jgi:MutS-like protein
VAQLTDPRAAYTARLEARRAASARQQRLHIRLGNWRLVLALSAAAIAFLAFSRDLLAWWWLLAPCAVYIGLAIRHERVLERKRLCDRAAALYQEGLARLDGRWSDSGETGDRFRDESHPYADDLDLFGKGSLFQLLCTARTRAGEETLARWLMASAPVEEARARHQAVDELRTLLDLREDLAVLGETVRAGVHAAALAAWGEAPPSRALRAPRLTAAALCALTIAAGVVWAVLGVRVFFFVMIAVEAVFTVRWRRWTAWVVAAVEHPAHDLALLSAVLERLERERFHTPRLAQLRAMLDIRGRPVSRRIQRLNRLIELLDSSDNVLVRVLGPLLLWKQQVAFAVEEWRRHNGPSVRAWLAAVGEFEALSALAGYAYEHPADPLPEFCATGPWFEGEGLGHPLMPEERFVRNDVRLAESPRVLVVSGSNMSGKSTLLRTVGVNTVLAFAGAPVRARRLRLSPLEVGASIRVLDSLQSGISRFYAEITRLRKIVDLTARPAPLLFLLDEFLHGTNSHDRKIGAEAIVRGLVDRGAIGLVTTHDLALAHIADILAPLGANVHFEDHLEAGKMTFDFVLRPGVVTHSNALELMRSVGLEV